jgi:hypothetical protein
LLWPVRLAILFGADFTPLFTLAVCFALSPPDAVFNLPPRAVAPSPPTEVMRPELSRVRRFGPRLTFFAAGLPPELPPPPAKRPRLSRL